MLNLHTSTAWVALPPRSVSLSVNELYSGFGVRLLNQGQFMLVIAKITFIMIMFAYGVQLTAFGIGGIMC
jgi:hypothetical protein